MSERERWIVYPLLFLALGAALRDKLFDPTTRRIVCQELIVVDDAPVDSRPLVLARIGRIPPIASGAPPGGYLVVNGPLSVAGAVDAQNYAIQGVPLLPALRAMISPADIWRALQQSTRALQKTDSNAGTPPPSGADEQAAPPKETTPNEASAPQSSN